MPAKVIPFPLARRSEFVLRQARSMAMRSPDLAEKYLDQQMRLQAETLARRGIAAEVVAHEVASLERAIRSRLAGLAPATNGGVA